MGNGNSVQGELPGEMEPVTVEASSSGQEGDSAELHKRKFLEKSHVASHGRAEPMLNRMVLLDGGDGDFHSEYQVVATLGKGSFGIVAECVHRATGQHRAVKILRKRAILTEKHIKKMRDEVQIMQYLRRHRHVVELIGVFEDVSYVYIVIELCKGGDMFRRLMQIDKYSERDAAAICREALGALSHMHSRGVVYRDLKPDNFLFDSPDPETSLLKAADFGLSCVINPGQMLTSMCGTPMYCAPEVTYKMYDFKADIWSLGVTLYIMLSGKVPFWGQNTESMFAKIREGNVSFEDPAWNSVTDAAKDCVRRMLTYDPKERPDAVTLLRHPWIVKEGLATAKPLVQSVYENLRQFMNMNKLQQRAVQIMARNLKLDDIKAVRKAFSELDRDQSGCICLSEMQHALQRANLLIPHEELVSLWSVYDVDGDGVINYVEFLTATTRLNKILTIENVRFAFEELDKDGNGTLSAAEVKAKMTDLNLSEDEVDTLIHGADKNNDGEIDYDEFLELMTQHMGLSDSQAPVLGTNMQSVAGGQPTTTMFHALSIN